MSDDYDYDPDGSYVSDKDNENPDGKADDEISIENHFYDADDIQKDDPLGAMKVLRDDVINREASLDENKREYTFKSYKIICLLLCRLLKENYTNETAGFNISEQLYKDVCSILKLMNTVANKDATDATNDIIDELIALPAKVSQNKCIEEILEYYKKGMEQLWNSATLRLCKKYFENKDFDNLIKHLEEQKARCRNQDGSDIESKSSTLLEIYSMEIQVCIGRKQFNKLNDILKRTDKLSYGLNDPKIMGVIKETDGKMLMMQKNYNKAYEQLLEAFKSYQEIGNFQAKYALKYCTIANILAQSDINPFSNQEAQAYHDTEIVAIQGLRRAYEQKDIQSFNNIVYDKKSHIIDDDFIADFIDELRNLISMEKIKNVIIPYERIKISYLGRVLQTDVKNVRRYLMQLILDNKIKGYIDDEAGYFENSTQIKSDLENKKEESLLKWLKVIETL